MRAHELNDIAAGICSSFISRNNKIEGYWALGKIYLHAKELKLNHIELDLLEKNSRLNPTIYTGVVEHYALWLKNRLLKTGNEHDVCKATVTLNFHIPSDTAQLPRRETWGDLFEVSVVIANSKGQEAKIQNYGYCAPHDPNRESRSSG
jgi:hypothetical protein|nr:hypothetical protein [uncultured Undibacterium sp.]